MRKAIVCGLCLLVFVVLSFAQPITKDGFSLGMIRAYTLKKMNKNALDFSNQLKELQKNESTAKELKQQERAKFFCDMIRGLKEGFEKSLEELEKFLEKSMDQSKKGSK
jgi:hypothetical protein